jgi:hypothetical protein
MPLIRAKQEHIDQALRMIDNFERGVFDRDGHRSAFNNLQRSSIVQGLRDRVNNPRKINQNQGSLCGPAAFCYCVLSMRPHLYVAYVIDLYRDGVGRINDLVVRPGKGCREFASDSSQIADVDWIALASLRDSTNSDFAYSSPGKAYAGITMPHDMVSWFTKAGFVQVVDNTNIVVGKKIETLLEANMQYLTARSVCLFVNASVIRYEDFLGFVGFPNHWVVLDAPVSKCQPDDVRFSVYSYGRTMDAPPHGRTLEQIELPNYFFGYVSAGPY